MIYGDTGFASQNIPKSVEITVRTVVYRLYGLSEEEIGVVEGSV